MRVFKVDDLKLSEAWPVFRFRPELIDGIESLKELRSGASIFGITRLQEKSPYYQYAITVAQNLSRANFSIIIVGG